VIPRNVQITLVLLFVVVLVAGVYIVQLRRGTQENLRAAAEDRVVAPPENGNRESVKLTIAYDDDGVFRSRLTNGVLPEESEARAKAILQLLIDQYVSRPSPHPLAAGSAVKTVFLVNEKLAVLDLNEEFAEAHRSGIMVEDFTVLSLIDTLASNFPRLEQVKFLVDGKERETLAGHVDLKNIYNTAAVHKLVERLQ
jgi:Sporulation and spore germination